MQGADKRHAELRYSFNCFNHSTHMALPPTLPAQIAAAAAAGYDHVGLDMPSLLAHEAAGMAPAQIGDVLAGAGVSCYELVPLPITRDVRATERATADVGRLASAVGARHVLATLRDPVDRQLADGLGLAVDHLAAHDIRVSVEFMPTSPLATLQDAVALQELVDRPGLGIVVDTWHFFLTGADWVALDILPVGAIGFVQLDDGASGAEGWSVEQSLNDRLLPGDGDFELPRFARVLADKGFSGVVSVEVLSRAWRSRPITDFAVQSLARAKAVFAGARSAGPSNVNHEMGAP